MASARIDRDDGEPKKLRLPALQRWISFHRMFGKKSIDRYPRGPSHHSSPFYFPVARGQSWKCGRRLKNARIDLGGESADSGEGQSGDEAAREDLEVARHSSRQGRRARPGAQSTAISRPTYILFSPGLPPGADAEFSGYSRVFCLILSVYHEKLC